MEEQIKIINEALQVIVNQMHELLSQPHLDLNIEFDGKHYHFHMPNDKSEWAQQLMMRENFIINLLGDAISELVESCSEEGPSDAWKRIISLNQLIVRKEDMVSPIASEEYEVVKALAETKRQIALNEEVYSVQVEMGKDPKPKGFDDEELRNITIKKSDNCVSCGKLDCTLRTCCNEE